MHFHFHVLAVFIQYFTVSWQFRLPTFVTSFKTRGIRHFEFSYVVFCIVFPKYRSTFCQNFPYKRSTYCQHFSIQSFDIPSTFFHSIIQHFLNVYPNSRCSNFAQPFHFAPRTSTYTSYSTSSPYRLGRLQRFAEKRRRGKDSPLVEKRSSHQGVVKCRG